MPEERVYRVAVNMFVYAHSTEEAEERARKIIDRNHTHLQYPEFMQSELWD
jgi:hypothetical protein